MRRMPVSATARMMPRRAWLGAFQCALHLLHPLPVASNNVSNVADAVELDLKVVDLRHDGMEPPNLDIAVVHQVASLVVHSHGDNLGLLGQVIKLLGDLLHEAVEVASQLREGAAVQYQKALGGRTAGCA